MSVKALKKKQTYKSFKDLPSWGTSDQPPTEILLFPLGETQATKFGGYRESVFLTEANGQAIVEEWSRRGITGHFDYNHAVITDSPSGTPSAGAFDLEMRSDGLWVVNIRWTPKMLEYFKAKEMQYYSPYFETTEGDDGKPYVTALLNVAITNWPATDQQKPLIALKATTQPKQAKTQNKTATTVTRRHNMDPKIQEAIKAILEKIKTDGEEADIAQAVLDIQAALAGAADPNASPSPDAGAEEIAASAREYTGKTKPADVKGALKAAFDAKSSNGDLIKRIHELESIQAKSLIDSSKLTPAQKTWAQGQLTKPNGFDVVKSFIEASSQDVPVGPHVTPVQPPEVKAEVQSDEPSKEIVAHCQNKGIDAKIYLKNWKIINPKKTWTKELA